jgi:hypothetical protein
MHNGAPFSGTADAFTLAQTWFLVCFLAGDARAARLDARFVIPHDSDMIHYDNRLPCHGCPLKPEGLNV